MTSSTLQSGVMGTALVRLSGVLLATLAMTAGCSKEAPAPIMACEKKNDVTPICQFHNPEDIEALPDNKTLLVSQMSDMEGSAPGSLVWYDTHSNALHTAFPVKGLPVKMEHAASVQDWGAQDCPGMPDDRFAPHGIALRQRDDGRWQLAVVNHGGRESVELFELLSSANGYALDWRGCVVPPDGTWMNDVALLGNGGFVASHMFDRHGTLIHGMRTGMWKAFLGFETGYVFEWQPQQPGIRIFEGSYGSFPNGVAVSADGKTVFANMCTGKEVRRLDRVSGKNTGSVAVPQPDNLSWDSLGRLLIAGVNASLSEQQACSQLKGQACGARFGIYRVDPVTLHSELVFEQSGAPMGAGTVARQMGDVIYIGSYTGDRIIRAPYH